MKDFLVLLLRLKQMLVIFTATRFSRTLPLKLAGVCSVSIYRLRRAPQQVKTAAACCVLTVALCDVSEKVGEPA